MVIVMDPVIEKMIIGKMIRLDLADQSAFIVWVVVVVEVVVMVVKDVVDSSQSNQLHFDIHFGSGKVLLVHPSFTKFIAAVYKSNKELRISELKLIPQVNRPC